MSDADSEEIRTRLAQAFLTKTAAQWDEFLRTQPEIIWERVRSWREVLDDPQSHANNYFTQVEVPGVGSRSMVGNLVHLSETPGSTKGDAPELGADTQSVLGGLSFTPAEIAEVEAKATAAREAALLEIAALKLPDN